MDSTPTSSQLVGQPTNKQYYWIVVYDKKNKSKALNVAIFLG